MGHKKHNHTFNLSRKLRHSLVAFLLVIFFAPYPVKLFDTVYHHHYTQHETQSKQERIDVPANLCPIPGFKFHSFIFQQPLLATEGVTFTHKIPVYKTRKAVATNYNLCFSLRAPPLLDNIS